MTKQTSLLKAGTSIYLTKYALTGGIFIDVVATDQIEGSKNVLLKSRSFRQYKVGVDIFLNQDEAIQAAIAMRERRVKSLEMQIKRILAKDFSANIDQQKKPPG